MTPDGLEILGIDHSGDSLHFRRGPNEADITPSELAESRKAVARWGVTYFHGIALDASEVDLLIKSWEWQATGERVQPLWPVEACRFCDAQAVTRVDWDFLCSGHAAGLSLRESEATA